MDTFQYSRVNEIQPAIQAASRATTAQQGSQVRFVAGGTTLLDLMKLNVERPQTLVDINGLPLSAVEVLPDGAVKIGALVRNADLARHAAVVRDYPVLSQALLAGASAQLRNMATTAGNLLQRTRCVYFRDTASACNKREPGSGCAAIGGENRMLAILGTSDRCIATNPSDMNVALTALEAQIHIEGVKGKRSVPVGEFFREPGTTPEIENVLEPGDLITYVTVPAAKKEARSIYLKLRDRASYEFALVSAAVIVKAAGGKIEYVRIALGGVGTKPWRAYEAERFLAGKPVSDEHFREAAEVELRAATPQSQNGFKVELANRCLVHALKTITETAG